MPLHRFFKSFLSILSKCLLAWFWTPPTRRSRFRRKVWLRYDLLEFERMLHEAGCSDSRGMNEQACPLSRLETTPVPPQIWKSGFSRKLFQQFLAFPYPQSRKISGFSEILCISLRYKAIVEILKFWEISVKIHSKNIEKCWKSKIATIAEKFGKIVQNTQNITEHW